MDKRERREEGESATEDNKCCWTWPVSNRHSSDRCNMFTKQTSSAHVREMKMVTWGCMTCEKKPGIHAGICMRALMVFQRDEKTACHTRIARVSRRICLMLLASSIPGSSGAIRGHRRWWAVFKLLTLTTTFHFRAEGKIVSHHNQQNNHLDLSSQTWGLPLWITVTLTSNKTSYTQPTLQQGSR